MSSHIYQKLEVVGSSAVSIDDAVKNAVAHAAKTTPNLRWLEVGEIRAHLDAGALQHWQVTVKIGHTLEA